MKNLSKDSQSLGRDLNPGPFKYEAELLTAQLLHSVPSEINKNIVKTQSIPILQ